MSNQKRERAKLSKNVLQMKFMQRNALNSKRDAEDEQQKVQIDDEHWVVDLPEMQGPDSVFLLNPSYVTCESLQFGRVSFKGFNPEIEKLMKMKNSAQDMDDSEEREQAATIGDEEMTERFESIKGTIGKKFKTKRERKDSEDGDRAIRTKTKKVTKKKFKEAKDIKKEDGVRIIKVKSETQTKKKKKRKFLKPKD